MDPSYYPQMSDTDLVSVILDCDDPQAKATLWERHQGCARKSARRILRKPSDLEDFEDVVMTTATRVTSQASWSRFRNERPESVCAWIGKIAERSALDVLRKRKGLPPIDQIDDADCGEVGDPYDQSIERILTSQRIACLYHCINRLGIKQRDVVFCYIQEQSAGEIATVLRTTPNRVHKNLHDAKVALGKCVRDHCPDLTEKAT